MKIKKSDLKHIYDNLDELRGFLSASLDFIDDYQNEYIDNAIDMTIKSLNILDKAFKDV